MDAAKYEPILAATCYRSLLLVSIDSTAWNPSTIFRPSRAALLSIAAEGPVELRRRPLQRLDSERVALALFAAQKMSDYTQKLQVVNNSPFGLVSSKGLLMEKNILETH